MMVVVGRVGGEGVGVWNSLISKKKKKKKKIAHYSLSFFNILAFSLKNHFFLNFDGFNQGRK